MTWPPGPPEADEIEFVCLTCEAKWSAIGTAIPDEDGWDIEVDGGDDECPQCPVDESDVDIENVSYA